MAEAGSSTKDLKAKFEKSAQKAGARMFNNLSILFILRILSEPADNSTGGLKNKFEAKIKEATPTNPKPKVFLCLIFKFYLTF